MSPSIQSPAHPTSFAIWLLVTLLASVALLELALRQEWVIAQLPSPILATSSDHFDTKLELLEREYRRHGRIDCVFIGNSMVNRGIDPAVFARAYAEQTGRQIHCQNISAAGIRLPQAVSLAAFLEHKYQPGMILIAAIPARDGGSGSLAQHLEKHPWYLFQQGEWSLDGWLLSHSRLVTYFLRVRLWLENPGMHQRMLDWEAHMNRQGWTRPWRHDLLWRQEWSPRTMQALSRQVRHFRIGQQTAGALEQLPTSGQSRYLYFEMPVHPDYLQLTPQWQHDYRGAISLFEQKAIERGEGFLRQPVSLAIPRSGWVNPNHMTTSGAHRYSHWLGRTVAGLAPKIGTPDPARESAD